MSKKAQEEFQKAMERRMNGMHYTIELDCPPGGIRPGDLIGDVIQGTGLPEKEPVSKVFGNWTWDYSDVPNVDALWPTIKATLKERIEKLYNRGTIRYGSW